MKHPWMISIKGSHVSTENSWYSITTTKQSKENLYFFLTSHWLHGVSYYRQLDFLVQQLIQVNDGENTKAPHCCPFVMKIHRWIVDSCKKVPVGKGFYTIITSPWFSPYFADMSGMADPNPNLEQLYLIALPVLGVLCTVFIITIAMVESKRKKVKCPNGHVTQQ